MLKNVLLAVVLLGVFKISSLAAVEVLKGVYQGKNLFVQNTMTKNMSAFSTKAVFVNDKKILSYPNTTSYEIDLSYLPLHEPLVVKIVYLDECKPPKVLNPQVIKPSAEIAFLSVSVDKEFLYWSTRGEADNGHFYVQKLLNKKWVNLQRLEGKRTMSSNTYNFRVNHHHGENSYKIKYVSEKGEESYSEVMKIKSNAPPTSFYPKSVVANTINFVSDYPVYYEIFDKNGDIVLQGKAKVVDCSSLIKGEAYTINFDDQHTSFIKK